MKQILENSVNTDRFSIAEVYNQIFSHSDFIYYQTTLENVFSSKIATHILRSIMRFSFYIEPVKQPKIESTKFTIRWAESLLRDSRFCCYEDCYIIFRKLLDELLEHIVSERKIKILTAVASHTLVSYELNLDYINRTRNSPIHTIENVQFFWEDIPLKSFALRKYLLNPNNHAFIDFFKATYEKIAVKSFLTDRALTGEHKTNREKRWECPPNSVHFALRKDCLAIEAKLIEQICHFEDFPTDLKTVLEDNHIINTENEVTKCPVTLDPISFLRFRQEILNPTHGKSLFQVGHLHPLKSIEDSEFSGHTADNISWISSIGNRIQGDLSLEETRILILHIIDNYKTAGFVD